MKAQFVAALLVSLATCVSGFAPVRTVRGVPARSTVSKDGSGMNSAIIRYSWQQPQNSAYGTPAQNHNAFGSQGQQAYGNQFGNQGGAGALPFGWSEENDGQGNTYYYNQQTGESAWERPGGMQQQQQQAPSRQVFGGTFSAAGQTPNRGAAGPARNSFGNRGTSGMGQARFGNQGGAGALPFGWSEENDGQGNTYYYNQQTGESAWERPGGMQQQQQQGRGGFGNTLARSMTPGSFGSFGSQRNSPGSNAQEDMYARLIREEQERHGGQPFTYGGSPAQNTNGYGSPGQSNFGGASGAARPGQNNFGGGPGGAARPGQNNNFGNRGGASPGQNSYGNGGW